VTAPTTLARPIRPGDLIAPPADLAGWALVGFAPLSPTVLEALIGPRTAGADHGALRAEALAALLLPARAAVCAWCGRPYLPHRPPAEGEGTWCPLDGCQRRRERAKSKRTYDRRRALAASPPPG
jgi:hypothetical protein